MVLPTTQLVKKFGEAGCKALTITLISGADAKTESQSVGHRLSAIGYRLNDKLVIQTCRFFAELCGFFASLRLVLLICN